MNSFLVPAVGLQKEVLEWFLFFPAICSVQCLQLLKTIAKRWKLIFFFLENGKEWARMRWQSECTACNSKHASLRSALQTTALHQTVCVLLNAHRTSVVNVCTGFSHRIDGVFVFVLNFKISKFILICSDEVRCRRWQNVFVYNRSSTLFTRLPKKELFFKLKLTRPKRDLYAPSSNR